MRKTVAASFLLAVSAVALTAQAPAQQPPAAQPPSPTGYKDTADAWVNTGALVNRINFALKLAQNDQALAQTLGAPDFQKR